MNCMLLTFFWFCYVCLSEYVSFGSCCLPTVFKVSLSTRQYNPVVVGLVNVSRLVRCESLCLFLYLYRFKLTREVNGLTILN